VWPTKHFYCHCGWCPRHLLYHVAISVCLRKLVENKISQHLTMAVAALFLVLCR
jgi:hypothetical protein